MKDGKRFIITLVSGVFAWFILSPIIMYYLFSAIPEAVRIYDFNGNLDLVLYPYFAGMEPMEIKEYGLDVFFWKYFNNIFAASNKAIIMGSFITTVIFALDTIRKSIVTADLHKYLTCIIAIFTGCITGILLGTITEFNTIHHILRERGANYELDYSFINFSILLWGVIGGFISSISFFLENLHNPNTINLAPNVIYLAPNIINVAKVFPEKPFINRMVIKTESLPKRCEICHQSDQFDPKNGKCYRCSNISKTY